MKHYIKPQIELIVSDCEDILIPNSLINEYNSGNKDLAHKLELVLDDEEDEEE